MKHLLKLLLPALLAVSCAPDAPDGRHVRLRTTAGDILLALDDRTPLHRDNFVRLVGEGAYDSLLFHRVIAGFMVQAGDPGSKRAPAGAPLGDGDRGYRVPAEFRYPALFHRRGVLAAARDDNPRKESSAMQFYIVTGRTWSDAELDLLSARTGLAIPDSVRAVYRTEGGTPHLDGSYTVFGRVVEGMETVDAIQRAATDANDRPLEEIRILRAEIVD